MQRRIIPGVLGKQQVLVTLAADRTALDASRLMAQKRIGAVIVVEGERLLGIVTERDIVVRVVAEGRDPAEETLDRVMTREPMTVDPDETAAHALDKMAVGGYRHLPVERNGVAIGIVSIRDLYEAIRASLREDLESAETLIYGDRYSVAAD